MKAIGHEDGGGRDRVDCAEMPSSCGWYSSGGGDVGEKEQSWETPRFLARVGVTM